METLPGTLHVSRYLQEIMHRISLLFILVSVFSTGPAFANTKEQFKDALDAARQRDYQYALETWETLAKKGHADSQYRLGVMYRLGTGVEKNLDKVDEVL